METIAAISTSTLSAAIGIIRISGEHSIFIASNILSKNGKFLDKSFFEKNQRKVIFCDLILDKIAADNLVAIYYQKPYSYTGEDVLELNLHGNMILLKKALSKILSLGAIPARKGEFTKRAFLNRKLDLNYAEAIHRLISAKTEFELQVAQKNMAGEMNRISSNIRSRLISLKAECEAEIDFSTEDLTYQTLSERKNFILKLQQFCQNLISQTQKANQYIDSMKVVLFGEPNTGKSSLMNELLGKNRSIVSDIEGTTRDYITENINLDGLSIQLVDTAGIRFSQNQIENLGMQKSRLEFQKANLGLYILDASKQVDFSLLEQEISSVSSSILVLNKIDIKRKDWESTKSKILSNFEIIEISCKTKQGLIDLQKKIYAKLTEHNSFLDCEDFVLLEERNISYIQKIIDHLNQTLVLMEQNTPVEIYIKEIDECLILIGHLNGTIENEEIFGRIFSNFCVGK